MPRAEAVWKVGGHLGTISVQQSLGNSIKEVEISINFVEPVMGIEPATCCLRNSCSATELHRPGCGKYGAATAIILAYGRAWGTPDGTCVRSIYRRGYYGFLTLPGPLVAGFRTIQKPLVARFYSNSGYPTFVTFRHYRVYGVESWVRILADVS